MVMTVLVVMLVVMMLVLVASAVAIFIVMMVMMLVLVIVMMLVIVAIALAILVVMMVMLMLMVLMIVATAVAVIIVMVMMLMLVVVIMFVVVLVIVVVMTANGTSILFHKLLDMLLKRGSLFKSRDESAYLKLISGGGDYNRSCILFSYESECLGKLCVGGLIGVAEQHTACVCYLITKELTEVLHIHLALVDVNDGNRAVKLSTLYICLKNCFSNVRELSYARGLDKDSVGSIFIYYLLQRFAEISYERAADTARIHLGDLDARVLKEAAVDADLAKLVLDEDELLARVRFLYELFNKGGLTCAEESGENIYFRHFSKIPLLRSFLFGLIYYYILFYYLFARMSIVLRLFLAKKYIFP